MFAVLALLSAVCYGAADFLGGFTAKRANTLAVVVVSQLTGLLLLVAMLPVLPQAAPVRGDVLWGALAGVTGGAGVALLYRALAIGVMAVVAPTTAVCAVAVPVLASVAMGERPAPVAAFGIGLGLMAIVLVSQQTAAETIAGERPRQGRLPPGVGIALVSGVAIGLFFLSLAQTRPEAGMYPILASRATSVALFGLTALLTRRSLRIPGALALTLVCGVIDMAANALYLIAAQTGPLSVVVTLSSLYPASTVILARIVLGERLNGRQVAGVGCALAAIVLIVSGGPP
jgi:uncharacterized membrane protein